MDSASLGRARITSAPLKRKMEDSMLQFLAKQAGVPQQVQDCLIASGYTTMSAIGSIDDIKIIESFFQRKHCIFADASQKNKLYGIFACAPELFEFLPGHVVALNTFVQMCKNCVAASEKRKCIWESAKAKSRRKFSKGSQSCESATVSTVWEPATIEQPKEGPSKGLPCSSTESKEDGRNSSEQPCTSSGILPEPAAANSSEVLDTSPAEVLALNVLFDIKTRLASWCQKNPAEAVRNLKFDSNYKVIVRQINPDVLSTFINQYEASDKEWSAMMELYSKIQTFMLCLMCQTNVQLAFRGSSFSISNATRHLLNCVATKNGPRKKRWKGCALPSVDVENIVINFPQMKAERRDDDDCPYVSAEIVEVMYNTDEPYSANADSDSLSVPLPPSGVQSIDRAGS